LHQKISKISLKLVKIAQLAQFVYFCAKSGGKVSPLIQSRPWFTKVQIQSKIGFPLIPLALLNIVDLITTVLS